MNIKNLIFRTALLFFTTIHQVSYTQVEHYLKSYNYYPGKTYRTYFKDMVGAEHLEKLARELVDYLKNPTHDIIPSISYLLVGPCQTGKSFFRDALRTMIQDEEFIDKTDKVNFFMVTPQDVTYFGGFAPIFNIARRDAPCVLCIDDLDWYCGDKNLTQELLTSINNIKADQSKKIILITATDDLKKLDLPLQQEGQLGKIITFDLPTYAYRKAYLEKELQKNNITLSHEIIETIAQKADGCSYLKIYDIIRLTLQLATQETRPVTQADFEVTLDREIKKN